MSKIEELILSQEFSYYEPWFYNNQYALRCELAKPDKTVKKRIKSAYKNAIAIYKIVFKKHIDAVFFHYANIDCFEKNAHKEDNPNFHLKSYRKLFLKGEKDTLKFIHYYQNKYKNVVIRKLQINDFDKNFIIDKNRVICYIDNKKFNHKKLIKRCVRTDFGCLKGGGKGTFDTSFVSFENECILSIYDDRGCDIVFATKEKYQEFYNKLQKYLLEYDLEEMKKRYNN